MTVKEMKEKRANIVAELRKLNDSITAEKREYSADEETKYEAFNTEIDSLTKSIERQEKLDSMNGFIGKEEERKELIKEEKPEERKVDEEEKRTLALASWLSGGKAGSEEHARSMGIDSNAKELEVNFRAQSGLDGSAGGLTVPRNMANSIESALLAFGGMMNVSSIIRTANGQPIDWPTNDDTGNTGEQVGENKAVNEQDLDFGSIAFNAYNFSSKMIKVPFTLLQDSAFNLPQFIGSKLGERLGRIGNTKWTNGTGAATINGIVPASTLGKTTAGANAITFDEIYDLIHSIDPAYRIGAKMMFHDNVLLAIRKLKDGEGQYLWQPSVQSGVPDRIAGFEYQINQDMASSISTTLKTIIFGLLTKYQIREAGTMRLRRLDERYAENDQVAFLGFQRWDGNLLDAGTNPVKYMQQA